MDGLKTTPGPWSVELYAVHDGPDGHEHWINASNRRQLPGIPWDALAVVYSTRQAPGEGDEGRDNAHLIAAAPDLYAALEDLLPCASEAVFRRLAAQRMCHFGICDIDECGECGRYISGLRALAKARGESDE